MSHRAGRHFLQIPGPSNVPDRILHAIAHPTIDHRGPDFGALGREVLTGIRRIFQTRHPVVIYPASGTGAWEAALVNTLSPGDRVLMVETGQFATLWRELAERLGLKPEFLPGDWRRGVVAEQVEAALKADTKGEIKAVCCVHNETSTGATSRIAEVRKAIDAAGHGALFLVDTISGLGSMDYRHDEWGVDVSVSGSQKGLMLPPGISFNALSPRALEARKSAGFAVSYWDWRPMLDLNETGYFPYTPNTNLLYGLKEAIAMLEAEGLANVFARHARHGEATRRAVQAWGLEVQCREPLDYSNVLTAVRLPEGHDADAFRKVVLDRFDMSLGNGLGKVKGRVFRIGHLGDFNDSMLMGTLANVEMGLGLAGVPHAKGGVDAAMTVLTGNAGPA
ncbi:MAG: aminotransferase class V-fold PLP-dependent enzyme [Alphaproteobacteria bacterium]|nr:aminotransferase class V-fold PLP-dependent enzyme [Alphaproteobacteria bacterium]MCB9929497.1 aminotransferase class V-fold PLP-dependent enzyme [Alphaproteobacteria bacterium]